MSKKRFFGVVIGVAALAILMGFILPMLMSAKSGIAVGIAVAIMMTMVVAGLYFVFVRETKKEEV